MALESASSVRKAAIRFSPVAKKKLERMMSTTASATVPGPVRQSIAVKKTQPAVAMSSSRFFAACASAQAPTTGAVSRTARYDTDSAAVQAKVAQSALPATAATK